MAPKPLQGLQLMGLGGDSWPRAAEQDRNLQNVPKMNPNQSKINKKTAKIGQRAPEGSRMSQKEENVNECQPFLSKNAPRGTFQGPSRGDRNHSKFAKSGLRSRFLDGPTPGYDFSTFFLQN